MPCYASGEAIRLGDIVSVGYLVFGKIVYLIDDDECCDELARDEWIGHDHGYVIQTAEGALLHCDDEAEMALLDRSDGTIEHTP